MAAKEIMRGFKYRAYPTPEQEAQLFQYVGVCRLVYNLALEQRRDFWRQHMRSEGKRISFAGQCRELAQLRAEFDWIAAVPSVAQTYALRDLDTAFQRFFRGRAGYPQMRRRGMDDAFRFRGLDLVIDRQNARWATVKIPKLSGLRFRSHRAMVGDVVNATVAYRGGKWWISFICRREVETPAALPGQVGIDRGIARTLALSTGEHMQAPDASAINKRITRARRILSRRKKGSARYVAQRQRLSTLTAKAARVRLDWSHRASTDIAQRFGLVAIEALNIKAMTASAVGTVAAPTVGSYRKTGLNRSILEQSWGQFATLLDYKLAERGGVLVSVPAQYTSQTCGACGVVDAKSRESQARFRCVHCGHEDNADRNAAVEILRRSAASVEGAVASPLKREFAEVRHAH